ncbi:MAG: patatin-like phospholipase family protein [Anaeromyxobacter sp.]|nr:patatin-like phospholipase family protein [Anaeromyxobacter sp.]
MPVLHAVHEGPQVPGGKGGHSRRIGGPALEWNPVLSGAIPRAPRRLRRSPPRAGRAPGRGAGRPALAPAAPAARAGHAPALAELRGPPALSLTISGGVSLGAYEAGQLHYMTEVLKANPSLGQLRLVTGASAGSTNGLMTILGLCAPEPRAYGPTKGPFWTTWIPLGLGQLWSQQRHGGRQGAFSRAWMEGVADGLEVIWRAGLREDCDVVLGVSVTRLVPRQVQTPTPGLVLPRVEEKLALRIQGRGAGRPPRLTNYALAGDRWPQHLLPEGPDGEVAWESLRELIFASTAFPLAFPPQPLRHCVAQAVDGRAPSCPPDQVRSDLFVDGGLFDNSPLRLAARLAGWGLRDDGQGGTRWLDAPEAAPEAGPWAPAGRTIFAYVTPDAAAYPLEEPLDALDDRTSALTLASRIAQAFVHTARAKNLTTLLEEYPAVADRIVVPLRHYPPASEPLAAFMGFFERDFREFDFFLGTYDARRMVVGGILEAVRRVDPAFRLRVPDDVSADGAWKALDCLRATLGERSGAAEACQGTDLESFRILLQASLFRLADHCARLPAEVVEAAGHPQCHAAAERRPPLLVPHVAGAAGVEWRRRAGEGDAAHQVRLLTALRFEWWDLDLLPDEGEEALPRIRERIGEVASGLSDRQPAEDRFVVGRVAGLAANALAYSPPRWLAWLALGRQLELGGSLRLRAWRHSTARLHAAAQLLGIHSAISSDRSHVAPALLAGLELRPRFLASVTWQPSLLLRAGVVLSPHDGLGAEACPVGEADPAACTRAVVQGGLALSVLESARLQLACEWYPGLGPRRPALWAVSPSLGVQVAF